MLRKIAESVTFRFWGTVLIVALLAYTAVFQEIKNNRLEEELAVARQHASGALTQGETLVEENARLRETAAFAIQSQKKAATGAANDEDYLWARAILEACLENSEPDICLSFRLPEPQLAEARREAEQYATAYIYMVAQYQGAAVGYYPEGYPQEFAQALKACAVDQEYYECLEPLLHRPDHSLLREMVFHLARQIQDELSDEGIKELIRRSLRSGDPQGFYTALWPAK